MVLTRPLHESREDARTLAGSAQLERALSIEDDSVLFSCTHLLLYHLEVAVDDFWLETFPAELQCSSRSSRVATCQQAIAVCAYTSANALTASNDAVLLG